MDSMTNKKVLAFDIGGSSVKFGLLDAEGNILTKGKFTVDNENIENFKRSLVKKTLEVKKEHDICGVAFSSPGSPDEKTFVIGGLSAVPCIHHNDWLTRFSNEVELPISIGNDANCALLAEVWTGNAKGLSNVISLVIGTGIGGALYLNGGLVLGKNLLGGEFGCMAMGRKGSHHNSSVYLSTNALVERVKKVADVKNGEEVFKLYDLKAQEVVDVVEEYLYELAMMVYNLAYCVDPDIILIGGGISSREDIVEKLTYNYKLIGKEINQEFIPAMIRSCKFKNDSNLIGAAYHFFSRK